MNKKKIKELQKSFGKASNEISHLYIQKKKWYKMTQIISFTEKGNPMVHSTLIEEYKPE